MGNDHYWCNYVVASIDILAQQEALEYTAEIPIEKRSQEKFIEADEQTAGYLEVFRAGFENIFNGCLETSPPIIHVPESKREKYDDIRKSLLGYMHFSDSIWAYIPLGKDLYKYHVNAVNGLLGIIVGCGGMLLFSLAAGKPFRAGIDIGTGTIMKHGDLYGGCLKGAHLLESQYAGYPRILLGNNLLNYLENLSRRTQQFDGQDAEDIEACKLIADVCKEAIVQDVDGLMVLDYLGNNFKSRFYKVADATVDYKGAYDKAFAFVDKEYQHYVKSGNNKLAVRYYLLLNYFRARPL